MKNKLKLGQLFMSTGVERLILEEDVNNSTEIARCVIKHQSSDWGDLCEKDKQANDYAVEHGERILSAYEVGKNKTKIWIITNGDRTTTTVILPEEY